MNLSTQIMLTVAGGAILIMGIGYLRNTVINLIMAPLLGFLLAIAPANTGHLWCVQSGLTSDTCQYINLDINRVVWIIASLAAYAMLSYVKTAPALDFSRALDGMKRRQAARRAVMAEVRRVGIFEVENA